MSRSSYHVVSALSRGVWRGYSYIADSCVFVNACLKVLEDGRIDHP